MTDALVLTLNSGSSSIKIALYRLGQAEQLVCAGQLDRLGRADSRFVVTDAEGRPLVQETVALPDHDAALARLFGWLQQQEVGRGLQAVGHRVVHGGPRYRAPHRVDADLLAELRRIAVFDPLHLPSEIAAIEVVQQRYPELPQVACFDTAFHRTLPDVARRFALPRHFADEGVYRYGFHGLSYEYIVEELTRQTGSPGGRLIIAHLGSGASMAAVRDGVSVDTTMGFTPTGGLVMATRTGDLDPGLLLYLLGERRMSADQLNHLLNHESGLLGVSGFSADMRELLGQAAARPEAAEAVALFCYQARKFVGALAAALGGLDTLVFTGGIGEHAAAVRRDVCADLGHLGVTLDRARNEADAAVISADGTRVTVRVVPTDEQQMIARQTQRLLSGRP